MMVCASGRFREKDFRQSFACSFEPYAEYL
jgi:hypothetical protein